MCSVIRLEPIEISVYDFGEDLIEYMRDLCHFQIEKLQYEDELLANCIYNQFVLGSEHFFKVVMHILIATDRCNNWLRCHSRQNIASLRLNLLVLLSLLRV